MSQLVQHPNRIRVEKLREQKQFKQQDFGQTLADYLEAKVDRRTYVEGSQSKLTIRAVGNTFTVAIEEGTTSRDIVPSHNLILHAVVSSSEADRFPAKYAKHYESEKYSYMVQRGGKGYYDQVCAIRKAGLLRRSFNNLTFAEKKLLLPEIAEFLLATQAFKADYR